MASGHVNRIKRPNTWLHRPILQNVKKALANPEPSTHGTKQTCRPRRAMSAFRGKAENICSHRVFPGLTLNRLGPELHLFGEFAAVRPAMSRTVIVETQR